MSPTTREMSQLQSFFDLEDDKAALEKLPTLGLAKKTDPLNTIVMMMRMMTRRLTTNFESVVSKMQSEIDTLSANNAALQKSNAELEDRVLSLEAYSGRATSILTGIPETPNENTPKVVADAIALVVPDFSISDISVAHRNKQKDSSKPRSITVVFKSLQHKDAVSNFKNLAPLISKGYGVFHYTPPSIRARKDEIESLDMVDRVFFDGANKMFSVKLKSGDFVRRVSSVERLLASIRST